jgi:hypothetical protein
MDWNSRRYPLLHPCCRHLSHDGKVAVPPRNRHHFRPGEKGQAAEELRRLLVVLEDEKRLFLRLIKSVDKEIAWVRQRLVFVQTGSEEPDKGKGGGCDVST